MFNNRDLTRHYYSSYSLLFACFGHFDFSSICTGRVYGARRSTSPLSANESRLQRIREEYARSKKKIAREDDAMRRDGGGQRWITAAMGIDVNEDFLTTSARVCFQRLE